MIGNLKYKSSDRIIIEHNNEIIDNWEILLPNYNNIG